MREVHDRAEFTTSTNPTSTEPGSTDPGGTRAELPGTGGEIEALRIAVDGSMCAVGLHRDPGRRVEQLRALVGVPRGVLAAAAAPVGLDVVRLDEDLDLWFDLDGAERHRINPAASVLARAFGLHEQVWGPVVFTGDVDPDGVTRDVPVAAAVLLAGTAASCDLDPDPDQIGRRRAEWAVDDQVIPHG